MKKIVLLTKLILILLASQYLMGQEIARNFGKAVSNNELATSGAEGVLTELWLKSLGNSNTSLSEDIIEGSPYFDAEFRKGSLYYDDEFQGNYLLRYNAYRDQIQLKPSGMNDTVRIGLIKDKRLWCLLDGKEVHFENFRDRSNLQHSGYLHVVIKSSDGTVYQRKAKRFMEGKVSANSLTRKVPPRFVDQIEFYFRPSEKDEIVEIPTNRKKAANLLSSDNAAELLKFMRNNKLRTSNEQDLMLMIQQLETAEQ